MKQLTYDDVALVPRYSKLSTRADADVSISLSTKKFKLPVIPSNMKCVINESLAEWMSANDYMYVMHRFDFDTYDFVRQGNVRGWKNISISIGVKSEDYELIKLIKSKGWRVDFITIDIAHGHSKLMKDMIAFVSTEMPNTFVIAGNVATPEGFDDLVDWGAHAVKVGIGPGAACTTKLKTGFTWPMFSCIRNIVDQSKQYSNRILIADGGIKHNGDIAKAIAAGADLVMCGKLFSECTDSPAPKDNEGNKLYYGSASSFNKNHKNNIEGTLIKVGHSGMTYCEKYKEIEQDLQSSVSYSGGESLQSLKSVDWISI